MPQGCEHVLVKEGEEYGLACFLDLSGSGFQFLFWGRGEEWFNGKPVEGVGIVVHEFISYRLQGAGCKGFFE